jgi:hypothetical protein
MTRVLSKAGLALTDLRLRLALKLLRDARRQRVQRVLNRRFDLIATHTLPHDHFPFIYIRCLRIIDYVSLYFDDTISLLAGQVSSRRPDRGLW